MRSLAVLLLTCLVLATGHAHVFPRKRCCLDLNCPMVFAPVCGTDGKTYGNRCFLFTSACGQGVRVAYEGMCRSRIEPPDCSQLLCPAIYQPVCGSDGKTYGSACSLRSANCGKDNPVEMVHDGPCIPATMTPKPDCSNLLCLAVYEPVCGTDGKTYGNACTLRTATCRDPTVQLAYAGECGSPSGPATS